MVFSLVKRAYRSVCPFGELQNDFNYHAALERVLASLKACDLAQYFRHVDKTIMQSLDMLESGVSMDMVGYKT